MLDYKQDLRSSVIAYYQPIVSLQTRKIIGYETLGRELTAGGVKSLGPFFGDASVSRLEHVQVDRVLREQAIRFMSKAGNGEKLFLNIKPSWIYSQYRENRILPTLKLIEKYAINPERVVIEITEDEFRGDLTELTEMIELYKRAGCTVAIDDVGSGFSSFDRIAMFQPKILKIDLKILKKSAHDHRYRALLKSFSILAEQIGASLLLEGVETRQDLQNAISVGARYVQGYLFAAAGPDLLHPDAFSLFLEEEIVRFGDQEFSRYRHFHEFEQTLRDIWLPEGHIRTALDADQVIQRLTAHVTDNCMRMYICREDGSQVSVNFVRLEDGGLWKREPEFRGSNWLWRPYFVPNILMMKQLNRGIFSHTYTDLNSSQLTQTYSCPLGQGYYLFLDLLVP